jgi:hypothetical protein
MKQFYITVASLPDRENLVAEVFYDGVQWAEISQENTEVVIQFYPHPRQDHWEFPLEDAMEALITAKKRFFGMGSQRD